MIETLAARGEGTSLIDLRLVRLGGGEGETLGAAGELCALVLSGTVEVAIDGAGFGTASRDGDVFEAMGDAVYVPPGRMLELAGVGDAVVAVASAPAGE